jgi:hypothetical protein
MFHFFQDYFDPAKHMAKAHGLKFVYDFVCDKCDLRDLTNYSFSRSIQDVFILNLK